MPDASDPLPYATPNLPGVGGAMRQRPEDFFVQEIPLYDASGEGDHLLFEIQKVGLTTREAIGRIARALGISPRDVGYAGLKDRHAITRQHLTVPMKSGVDEERVMRLEVDDVIPQWADRHGNKLKMGHLAGNRFAVRLREVDPMSVVRLRPILDRLEKDGLPNYYGEQRFGRDPHRPNDRLGMLLLRGDLRGFCDAYLGGDDGRPDVAEARRRYDTDGPAAALEVWPENIRGERAVLEALVKTGDPVAAVRTLDRKLRQLLENAAQSAVFNATVAERVDRGHLAQFVVGDVAIKHADDLRTSGRFLVDDVAAEQPRCEAWEISPTAPMPGGKIKPAPTGAAADMEAAVLDRLSVSARDFSRMPGERRPARVRPIESKLSSGVDEHGGHITVAFALPSGSFATTLMRELTK